MFLDIYTRKDLKSYFYHYCSRYMIEELVYDNTHENYYRKIYQTNNKSELIMYLDLMLLKPDIKNIKRDNFNLDIFDSFSELGEILTLHLKEKEN
jgi:hypothetical protein